MFVEKRIFDILEDFWGGWDGLNPPTPPPLPPGKSGVLDREHDSKGAGCFKKLLFYVWVGIEG